MAAAFASKAYSKTGRALYPEGCEASLRNFGKSGAAWPLWGLHLCPAHRVRPGLGLFSLPAGLDWQALQEISPASDAFLQWVWTGP